MPGERIEIRPIRPEDREALAEGIRRMSPDPGTRRRHAGTVDFAGMSNLALEPAQRSAFPTSGELRVVAAGADTPRRRDRSIAHRFSRNPMYVGGVAIWGGWAVLLGSAPVVAGLVVLQRSGQRQGCATLGLGARTE